jgi:hypothetical protein
MAFAAVDGSFRARVSEKVFARAEDKTGLGSPAVAAQGVFLDSAPGFLEWPRQASEKAVPLAVNRRFLGPRQPGRDSQTYDQRQQAARPHSLAHVAALTFDEAEHVTTRSYRQAAGAAITGCRMCKSAGVAIGWNMPPVAGWRAQQCSSATTQSVSSWNDSIKARTDFAAIQSSRSATLHRKASGQPPSIGRGAL